MNFRWFTQHIFPGFDEWWLCSLNSFSFGCSTIASLRVIFRRLRSGLLHLILWSCQNFRPNFPCDFRAVACFCAQIDPMQHQLCFVFGFPCDLRIAVHTNVASTLATFFSGKVQDGQGHILIV